MVEPAATVRRSRSDAFLTKMARVVMSLSVSGVIVSTRSVSLHFCCFDTRNELASLTQSVDRGCRSLLTKGLKGSEHRSTAATTQLIRPGSTPVAVARKKPRLVAPRTSSSTPAPTSTTLSAPCLTADSATTNGIMTSMLASAQPSLNDAIAESQQPLSATLQACGLDFKQMLLNNFRDEMADHFPFLAHGPLREYSATTSLDASTCEEKAPFTMAAVFMSALHRHCVLQKRVSQELLASLVSAMLLQGKKSLDLLFCILVVSACE